jgi:hypothetical protein
MKQIFSQHHRLSEEEQKALWNECIFTLDANALLNIYRYADATRDDLFRVLEGLKGRIWISHQAAKEFYKNRITVIKDQRKKYDDLRQGLEKAMTNLRGGEFTKSAFLKIAEIEEILRPAVEKASEKISDWRSKHPDLLHNDPFLERIAMIIGDSIGQEPEEAGFDESCNRAKERIAQKQPPGYMDEKKSEPDRYGDVLIWFEMLEFARTVKKPIMLLTDDEKEDWWQIEGGEKLGPRPELREEMRKEAGVDCWLASPAHFLEFAGSQLKVVVSQSSLDNATEVAAQVAAQNRKQVLGRELPDARRLREPDPFGREQYRCDLAVKKWVLAHLGFPSVVATPEGPFDMKFMVGNNTVGVVVHRHGWLNPVSLSWVMKETFLRAHYEITQGEIVDFWLFFVTRSPGKSKEAFEMLSHGWRGLEPRYHASIGYLTSEGEYEEFASMSGDALQISKPQD